MKNIETDTGKWIGKWIGNLIINNGQNIFKGSFIGTFNNNTEILNWSGIWMGFWNRSMFEGFYKQNNNISYIERNGIWQNLNRSSIFTGSYNKKNLKKNKENIKKFIDQQQINIKAFEELEDGKKLTHWIWYFFPMTGNEYASVSGTSNSYLLTINKSYDDIIYASKQYLM